MFYNQTALLLLTSASILAVMYVVTSPYRLAKYTLASSVKILITASYVKAKASFCASAVNAPSFLDKHERKLAFALLKHGFVHCLGSDSHNMSERAPDFTAAKAVVKEAGLEDMWKRAEDIMEKILTNQPLEIERGKPIKKCLGIYR